jgi:hypothetical protein
MKMMKSEITYNKANPKVSNGGHSLNHKIGTEWYFLEEMHTGKTWDLSKTMYNKLLKSMVWWYLKREDYYGRMLYHTERKVIDEGRRFDTYTIYPDRGEGYAKIYHLSYPYKEGFGHKDWEKQKYWLIDEYKGSIKRKLFKRTRI